MAFGFKSLPTRKYVYRIVRMHTIPETEKALVDQLHLAHKYQNQLVEIELQRRAAVRASAHRHSPALQAADAACDTILQSIRAEEDALAASNIVNRKKVSDDAIAASLRTLRANLKAAYKAATAARKAAYTLAPVKAECRVADRDAVNKGKAARKAIIAEGLYWGSAALVPQRVKKTGLPPRFRRWDCTGSLAVQFQRKPDRKSAKVPVLDAHGVQRKGKSGKPMFRQTSEKPVRGSHLFAGASTLVRLTPTIVNGQAHRKRVDVQFRIGSTATGQPIWANFCAVLHRPLPEFATIKWATLVRTRIGPHFYWELQFDLSAPSWPERIPASERTGDGVVAVALGWRRINGEIRVAAYHGSDGATGEVIIPADRVSSWEYVDRLQGIADSLFEALRNQLVAWLETQPGVPSEFSERTATLGKWRSSERFCRLITWWRFNRFPGDQAIFDAMDGRLVAATAAQKPYYTGGRKQLRHLTSWREHQRVNVRRWRKNFYREVALTLARRYTRVVVANIDWAELGCACDIEEADQDVNRRYRGLAAGAMFQLQATNLMQEIEVSAAHIIDDCALCGQRVKHPGRGRWIRCERCGDGQRDRAANAAKNLLARGLAALGTP